ncbi:MAG: cation diffusion facilitator family transporter [Chthoniobacteraceae bacterium]
MTEAIPPTRAPLLSILVNAFLAVLKITVGMVGHSYALMADGIESCGDIISSMVVYGGLYVASIPADENHPYGHGRAESLAAVFSSCALIAAACIIGIESIREILTPHLMPRWYTLVVLAFAIVAKVLLSRYVGAAGKSIDSSALKGDALHHFSDALISLAAFVGISIGLIGGHGYESADDWAALLACFIILYNGVNFFRSSIDNLMDVAPSAEIMDKIRAIARNAEGVTNIEKFRMRKSGLFYLVDVHVEVDGSITVQEGHQIAHRVSDLLRHSEYRIADATVHIEPDTH